MKKITFKKKQNLSEAVESLDMVNASLNFDSDSLLVYFRATGQSQLHRVDMKVSDIAGLEDLILAAAMERLPKGGTVE